jgi:hypothetical protein
VKSGSVDPRFDLLLDLAHITSHGTPRFLPHRSRAQECAGPVDAGHVGST